MILLNVILFFFVISEVSCNTIAQTFWQVIDMRCPTIPELDRHKIKENKLLGKGSFGSVYLAEYKTDTGTASFALKKIFLKTEQGAVTAAKETCDMYNINHAPHVVKVYCAGFVQDKDGNPFALLAMDLYDANLRQTLEEIILNPSESPFASSIFADKSFQNGLEDPVTSLRWTSWLRSVFHQLVLAVKETHDNGVLHLDIKPDNFLAESSSATIVDGILVPRIALSDFGLARMMNLTDGTNPKGTFEYMAPEIFKPYRDRIESTWKGVNAKELIDNYRNCKQGDRSYMYDRIRLLPGTVVYPTSQSDIYSLGVTFHSFATRKFPFEKRNGGKDPRDKRVIRILSVYDYKGPQCSQTDEKLCELIEWMMSQDPNERPSIQQILDHQFFDQGGIRDQRTKRSRLFIR